MTFIGANKNNKNVKTGAYLIPNLITATSLFFGLLAIKLSIDASYNSDSYELFIIASYSLIAAIICDGIDGSIARLTQTQSSFGMHFDSLCDLSSFGIAPAILMYNFALNNLGRIGFCLCFIYTVCIALRLARFNVQTNLNKKSENFTGIPAPMAAAPIAFYILVYNDLLDINIEKYQSPYIISFLNLISSDKFNAWLIFFFMFLIALGTISTFEYKSLKKVKLTGKKPFRLFSSIIILITLILAFDFFKVAFTLLCVYCLYGPVAYFFKRKSKHAESVSLDEQKYFEPLHNKDND